MNESSKNKYKTILIYVLIFLTGIIVSFIAYKLLVKYNEYKNVFNFFENLWNYEIYKTKENTVSFGKLIIAITLILFGVFSARSLTERIVSKILNKTKMDNGAKSSISNIIYYVLIVLFSLMALNIADVPLTILTIFGGALAIGVGFGSQNLVSNFMSGLIIQFERPVKVGDYVEIESTLGSIVEIGARSTKILTSSNSVMVIPNSLFLDKKFINWTLENNIIRGQVNVGITNTLSAEIAIKEIKNLLKKINYINTDREPLIFMSDLSESSCIYTIFFWIDINNITDKVITEGMVRSTIQIHFLKLGYVLFIAKEKKDILNNL